MSKTNTSLIRKRKTGTSLMLFFTVGWLFTMVTIQFSIGVMKGYGTGFGDGKRMPPSIVEQAGVGNDVAAVVAATSHSMVNTPFWEDAVRLIATLAALIGLTLFWYAIISRVGTF